MKCCGTCSALISGRMKHWKERRERSRLLEKRHSESGAVWWRGNADATSFMCWFEDVLCEDVCVSEKSRTRLQSDRQAMW